MIYALNFHKISIVSSITEKKKWGGGVGQGAESSPSPPVPADCGNTTNVYVYIRN